jgi:hypothetical protein
MKRVQGLASLALGAASLLWILLPPRAGGVVPRILDARELGHLTGARSDFHKVLDKVCTAMSPQQECDSAQDPYLHGSYCNGPGNCDHCLTQVGPGDTVWRCTSFLERSCKVYNDPYGHGVWDCGRKANGTCVEIDEAWYCQYSASLDSCANIPLKVCVSNVSNPGG